MLQALALFNMGIEAGNLSASIDKDPDVYNYIRHYNANADSNALLYQKAQPTIELLVQFYSTVYNQWKTGVIGDVAWKSLSNEISAFFQVPPVQRWWHERGAKGKYDDDFKKFLEISTDRYESLRNPK